MQTILHAFSAVLTGRMLSPLLAAVFCVLGAAVPALAQESAQGRTGGILNIILLAGIAYFLVRSFRRRSGGDNTRPGRWSRPDEDNDDRTGDEDRSSRSASRPADRYDAARQTWDWLGGDEAEEDKPSVTTPTGRPDAFNEAEFLEGAKMFFSRFQQAVDDHDLDSISDFISDEIHARYVAGQDRERTEIMLLNAKLMELKTERDRTTASVYYDAQLRVGEEGRPVNLRTVWEFSRDERVPNALWVLEKINSIDQ